MYAIAHMVRNVCVKEEVGDWEISISFNDSFGSLHDLSRSDIRVYSLITKDDYTDEVAQKLFDNTNTIAGEIYNLISVYRWCVEHSR